MTKSVSRKVLALAMFVGALPFLFCARAYADAKENKFLDDYSNPVGLTFGAQAKVQTAYLWRGLYCGGANVQASANIGYGGLYADMWWNVGTTDWSFNTFLPEVDLSVGFARWGLDVFLLYVYNFNCGFFDITNYPDKGNRLEIDARYTVSSKFPLSFLWATRIAAADSYMRGGDTVRAWSSYAEISYTQNLPSGWSLYGAFGITPWTSCYTFYERGFAIQNVEIRLRKAWEISRHFGAMIQGQVCVNPYAIQVDKSSIAWKPLDPGRQSINANLALGIYLR